MATPLPLNSFDLTHQFASRCAYIKCLDLENRHATVAKSGNLTVLICARFLGYMLVEAPSDAGRQNIASEIIRCPSDEALQALAELYKNHFMRCCESKLAHSCVFLTPALQFSVTRVELPYRLTTLPRLHLTPKKKRTN